MSSQAPREVTRRKFLYGLAAASTAAIGTGVLVACQPAAPAAPTAAAAKPTTAPAAQAATTAPAAASAAKPTSAPTTAPAATSAPAAAAAAAPRRGGTISGALAADPPGLDPHVTPQLAGQLPYSHIYSALVKLDADFQPQPDVAEKWDVSPDGRSYTFRLKKGVKFHNGREMTADDVKYSFERVLAKETASPWISQISMIDTITVSDPQTVRVDLKFATPLFLKNLGLRQASMIVAGEVVERETNLLKADGGSGPFKLASWEANNFVALERFDDYHEQGMPYVDGIRWRVLPEGATRQAGLRTAQLDWATLGQTEWEPLVNDPQVTTYTYPEGGINHIWLNHGKAPLGDQRVRQAMSMAIDRQEIVTKAFGTAEPSGPVPFGHPSYALTKAELPAYYAKPDMEGARKLLADAGFPNGFQTSLSIIPAGYPEMPATAQLLQQQWKQIGIDLQLRSYAPGAALGQDFRAGNWDMLEDLFTFKPDADSYVYDWFHGTNGNPSGGRPPLKDAEIDSMLDRGRMLPDGPERAALYRALQLRMLEVSPNIWLHNRTTFEATSKRLQGYQPTGLNTPALAFIKSSIAT